MARVVVLGYVVRGPIGGVTWHHLQYCVGLHRMGHDVWFVEDSDDYPSCYDPRAFQTSTDPTYGLRYAAQVFERVGLGDRWAYLDQHSGERFGPAAAAVGDLARTADVVLNVSGVNPLGQFGAVPARVFVDTDPVFTQVRHLHDARAHARAAAHTHHATFATSVGTHWCGLPDDGFPWQPTRQPVVADLWPQTPLPTAHRFTTVMQWDSYPAVEHGGIVYGMKSASFERIIDLPRRCPPGVQLEVAVGSPGAPRERLRGAGWVVTDPGPLSVDPWTFQRYLQVSAAELTVAKHGYVAASTGWFSERSAGYLASGRPVVAEDTGFSSWLPTGDGLLAFRTADEAAEAVAAVAADLPRHSAAARHLVEDHFRHDRVLTALLDLTSG